MLRAVQCLAVLLLMASFALSPAVAASKSFDIAIDQFTSDPSSDADFNTVVPGLYSLLINDVLSLLEKDRSSKSPVFGKCPIRVIEWVRRADALKELEFQQSKSVDPRTRAKPDQVIKPNLMINTHVALSGNTVRYTTTINHHPSGKPAATLSGEVPSGDLLTALGERIARELAQKLCKPKGFVATAKYNDLSLAGTICDPASPFKLKGKGATSGIVFSFTPASDTTGTFSIAGTAGGVPWSGGGQYDIAQTDGSGRLTMTGKWRITTPVGVFPGAGKIPGKLSPAGSACALK